MAQPFYARHQLAELQEGHYAVNRTYERLKDRYSRSNCVERELIRIRIGERRAKAMAKSRPKSPSSPCSN
jgi:hypothetical protein